LWVGDAKIDSISSEKDDITKVLSAKTSDPTIHYVFIVIAFISDGYKFRYI